jgi:saccharopine dehydrogenase-like NADP-dependent oxidoreductase
MSGPTVLLIGCGRMGRGIARMLLREQTNQHFPISLWIYDPYLPAETQCLQEVQHDPVPGIVKSLREFFSESIGKQVSHFSPEAEPEKLVRASEFISNAVRQLAPRLILNAATYLAHQMYIPLARELRCDYLDLGQNLPAFEELKALDTSIAKNKEEARIIQETGLAPGLVNILAVSMYNKALQESSEDMVYSVQMRVGGLPQDTSKGGKLHYGPTFSPEGLLFEYEHKANGLRNSKLVTPTTFSHSEYWESTTDVPLPFGIAPFTIRNVEIQSILMKRIESEFLQESEKQLLITNLEARPTADGTSRMCFDPQFQQTVSHLEYKTLRFAPHYKVWEDLEQTGRLASILAHWKQHIDDPTVSGYPDLVLLRVWAQASLKSKPHTIELITLHDDVPIGSSQGFTAMQHLTGWPTVLLAMALLQHPSGSKDSQSLNFFRPHNSLTAFNRTIAQVLSEGGIIAPFELIDGLVFVEELQKNRIPLCEIRRV